MADAEKRPKRKGNIVVWAVLGLLILALGGFGVGEFGGSVSTVAQVGDREVTVQDYANAIRQEQRRLQQQTGQSLTMEQMRQFGLDQQVMERLLASAALEQEARRLDVSVGDAEVAQRITANRGFAGPDGNFDRDGYAFALRQLGLNARVFEERVRAEAASEILQTAVLGGVGVRDAQTAAIVDWLAERRSVTLARIGPDAVDGPAPDPSDEDLAAYYEANGAAFELPETRRLTYAWITPDLLAPSIEVPEADVAARYESLSSEFRQPARVLAERLVFADADSAAEAAARIEAGETDFDALVEARGLTLDEVDAGELSAADLPGPAAEAVFALNEPGVVGPVETSLGPALFRVNAILDATETPLDAVRDELVEALAREAAVARIDAARDDIDDLLAGGATLEELSAETDLELGFVALRPGESEGIAGYDSFREAAAAAEEGDFPELGSLADGGLFALRLEGIDPPRTPPLDDVRAEVEAAWRDDRAAARLTEAAEAAAARIEAGEDFEAVGLVPETVEAIARDGRVEGLSPAQVRAVFEAAEGDVLALGGTAEEATVLRVDSVAAPDPADAETAELAAAIEQQIAQQVSGDLFAAYATAVRARTGFTVDQGAVQAVQSQLLGGN